MKSLMPEGAGQSPREIHLRISPFILEILVSILIGALGGMLVYRAMQARGSRAVVATPAAPTSPVLQTPAVRRVDFQSVGGNPQVTIVLDQMVAYDAHRLDQPDRVYIDLHGLRLAPEVAGTVFANIAGLSTIRLAQTQPNTVRIVLDLEKRFDYVVNKQPEPATLVLQLTPATGKAKHRAKDKTKKAAPPAPPPSLR